MLHRKVRDHWLFTEKRTFTKFEAWVDLLLEVNHKDNKFMLGGELVEVKRGQTITSIRQLCDRWNWSNTKVTKFLKMLEMDEMLTVKSDTKKTVITIDKYDIYQISDSEKRHEDDTETSQKHTNKNDNNDNNKKPSRHKYETCDMEAARLLFNLIQQNNENAKEPDFEKWANEFRLMRERDNRTIEQIKYLINWSQNDSFWKANILSPVALRKQFDKLVIRVKEEKSKPKAKVVPFQSSMTYNDLDLEGLTGE